MAYGLKACSCHPLTLYLSHHDGKAVVDFDLAQTAGMA